MDIEIGRAPDYVMRRGQEILYHRMKLVIHRQGQKIFDELFTSRSLAMVLRQGRSVFERQSFFNRVSGISLKIETPTQWSKVVYEILDQKVEFVLYLPFELTKAQSNEIIGVQLGYFERLKK